MVLHSKNTAASVIEFSDIVFNVYNWCSMLVWNSSFNWSLFSCNETIDFIGIII